MNAQERRKTRNNAIIELYLQGLPVARISQELFLTTDTTYKILREAEKAWEEDFPFRKIPRLMLATKTKELYRLGYTEREIAEILGCSQPFVNRLKKHAPTMYQTAPCLQIKTLEDIEIYNDEDKVLRKGDYLLSSDGSNHYCSLRKTEEEPPLQILHKHLKKWKLETISAFPLGKRATQIL